MSGKIRYISDLHFGHESMAIKRGFVDADEMNKFIIKSFNSVVNKRDTTYILGDITMEKSRDYYLLDQLKGYINIVLGNHDRRQDVPELLTYVNSIAGAIKMGPYIVTHIPVHEEVLRTSSYTVNIHGHVHEHTIGNYIWDHLRKSDKFVSDKRYINVSCENIQYIPRTIEELIKMNK